MGLVAYVYVQDYKDKKRNHQNYEADDFIVAILTSYPLITSILGLDQFKKVFTKHDRKQQLYKALAIKYYLASIKAK